MSIETIKNHPIHQWSEEDRPREKLLHSGRLSLSDSELLAILIATGTRNFSAIDLARKTLALADNNLNQLGKMTVAELCKIPGIGEAKAITLIASMELGRRRNASDPKTTNQITCSKDSYNYFEPLTSDLPYETFWVLLLNRSNKIIKGKRISEGGISGTVVDMRIIFKFAIENLASSVILCHNHPSGSVRPSNADIELTRKIRDGGRLIDVAIIDHIITGDKTYFSFSDEGLL